MGKIYDSNENIVLFKFNFGVNFCFFLGGV